MRHRRGRLRRSSPWLLAGVLLSACLVALHRAFGDHDVVAIAAAVREGDAVSEVPRDPVGCIQILEPVLLRDPDHVEARLLRAAAWADLKAWDNAITDLEHAAAVATDPEETVRAKRLEIDYLIFDDRYDEAVAVAQQIVELQPTHLIRPLQLGAVYLKGSQTAQAAALKRFQSPTKTTAEEIVERRIEAFATDVWGQPDLDALVEQLAPDADPKVVRALHEHLGFARERFLLAVGTLAGYPDYAGFDFTVARAYVEVLQRSGRLYEAHIESGIALREPSLNAGQRKDFLETQAQCAEAVGNHAQAADLYQRIVDEWTAAGMVLPPRYLAGTYESRVRAGQFDWILQHVDADLETFGDEIMLLFARSVALHAAGRTPEAVAQILDPYATLTLGSRTLLPASVKSEPQRRHDIMLLAYQLFAFTGDSRAKGALDALLREFPDDLDSVRVRVRQVLAEPSPEAPQLEAAVADALSLLRPERRDHADFELWLAISDKFSVQRQGFGLAERARGLANQAAAWDERSGEGRYLASVVGERGLQGPGVGDLPMNLFFPGDPAVSFQVIDELARRGSVERARNEMRKLVEAHPGVQEFRHRLGRLLVREGRLDSASVEFRELLRQVPLDAETLDLAMRTDDALGRHRDAADLLNEMVLAEPLGVGAVRYGQRLLRKGHPEQTKKLIERILRWNDWQTREDILLLSARADLALGDVASAQATLNTANQIYPDSLEVALLGVEVGLAASTPALVTGALHALQPRVADLLPDQMSELSGRLLDANLLEDLLDVVDAEARTLPSALPALRAVAEAAKAVGQFDEADALLARLQDAQGGSHDAHALLDRFLLLALQGRAEEGGHWLRLQVVRPELREEIDFALLAGGALAGQRVLVDAQPLRRLDELAAARALSPRERELLDALLRLLPSFDRLQDVLPASVLKEPRTVYPVAGGDVERLLGLHGRDPALARETARTLLLLLLCGERPFWEPEIGALAWMLLQDVPELEMPALRLARLHLAQADTRETLELLAPLLTATGPSDEAVALFLQASREHGNEEWGVALALALPQAGQVPLLLAESLLAGGHAASSVPLFEAVLGETPGDARACAGLLRARVEERSVAAGMPALAEALAAHPQDAALAATAADALSSLHRADGAAHELLATLHALHPGLHAATEALARAQTDDPPRVEELLSSMLADMAAHPVRLGSDEGAARNAVLSRAAKTARTAGLTELLRALLEEALRSEPGSIATFRELAFLELDAGRLERARRYLEALSFVDLADREAALALARLDFEQLGHPLEAADVVERAFSGSLPPEAAQILAAKAYLLGDVEAAFNEFYKVVGNPLITEQTVMNVARIAYASGTDDTARSLFELVKQRTPEDSPLRQRAEYLLKRLPKAN